MQVHDRSAVSSPCHQPPLALFVALQRRLLHELLHCLLQPATRSAAKSRRRVWHAAREEQQHQGVCAGARNWGQVGMLRLVLHLHNTHGVTPSRMYGSDALCWTSSTQLVMNATLQFQLDSAEKTTINPPPTSCSSNAPPGMQLPD